MCPWRAELSHRNGKADCPAQGRKCYSCGRMNHLSIACKHPIPHWREGTEPLSAPCRGRPSASKPKQQVRHVDVEEEYDGFQYDNFRIDNTTTQAPHRVNTIKYRQRSRQRGSSPGAN